MTGGSFATIHLAITALERNNFKRVHSEVKPTWRRVFRQHVQDAYINVRPSGKATVTVVNKEIQ